MHIIRSLGKDIGYFIILETLISLLVRASWRPILSQLCGIALAAVFILTILKCLLGAAAPEILYRVDRGIAAGMFAVVAVCAALSFSMDKISTVIG